MVRVRGNEPIILVNQRERNPGFVELEDVMSFFEEHPDGKCLIKVRDKYQAIAFDFHFMNRAGYDVRFISPGGESGMEYGIELRLVA